MINAAVAAVCGERNRGEYGVNLQGTRRGPRGATCHPSRDRTPSSRVSARPGQSCSPGRVRLVATYPERGRPAADQVRERHPDAEEMEIEAAPAVAETVERRAYDLSAPSWSRGSTRWKAPWLRTSAKQSLRREFTWLDGELLSRLVNHAHYLHFRD